MWGEWKPSIFNKDGICIVTKHCTMFLKSLKKYVSPKMCTYPMVSSVVFSRYVALLPGQILGCFLWIWYQGIGRTAHNSIKKDLLTCSQCLCPGLGSEHLFFVHGVLGLCIPGWISIIIQWPPAHKSFATTEKEAVSKQVKSKVTGLRRF